MPTERCYLAGSNSVKIALFLKQADLNDIFYGRGHDLPQNPQTGSTRRESEAELNPEKGVFLGGRRGIGGRSGMHPSYPEGKPRDCDPRIFLRKKIGSPTDRVGTGNHNRSRKNETVTSKSLM